MTLVGNKYDFIIEQTTVGSDYNLVITWSSLPHLLAFFKFKYKDKDSAVWTIVSGGITSPQNFTIPTGNYDYNVQLTYFFLLLPTETVSFTAPETVYLEVSHLNPMNFVDKNRELPLNYNFKHFDTWKDCEQQLPFETKKCYHQPWQKDQIAWFQVKANFSPIRLQVRDYKGLIVHSEVFDIVRTIGSDIYFQAQVAFDSFDEGVYTMDIIAGDPVLITLTSEKFEVREEWPDTILVNYQNSFNNKILWETGISINFRFHGVIVYEAPISTRTVYIDQLGAAQTVKGDAARKFKLFIGTNGGTPTWVIDKMDEIVDQTEVEYDGKPFAPVPGADWSSKKIERYPWAQWNLDMRECVNRRAKRYTVSGIQEKKVVVEYIVEGRLFGAVAGESNDNSYTINEIE